MSTNQNIPPRHCSPNRERNGYVLTMTNWNNRATTHTCVAPCQSHMIEERGPTPGSTHRDRLQEEMLASAFSSTQKTSCPHVVFRFSMVKKLLLLLFGFVSVALASCSRVDDPLESRLTKDIDKISYEFLHFDEVEAKKSLINFIKRYDTYIPTNQDRKEFRFEYLMGMHWLWLYSMYYCENNSSLADGAMEKAIIYFDTDKYPCKAESYLNNNKKYLHDFVFGIYHNDTSPKWYLRYKSSEPPAWKPLTSQP